MLHFLYPEKEIKRHIISASISEELHPQSFYRNCPYRESLLNCEGLGYIRKTWAFVPNRKSFKTKRQVLLVNLISIIV